MAEPVEYVPAVHATGAVEVEGHAEPAGQAAQLAPPSEYCPPAHATGNADAVGAP